MGTSKPPKPERAVTLADVLREAAGRTKDVMIAKWFRKLAGDGQTTVSGKRSKKNGR